MSLDYGALLAAVKKAAVDAVLAQKPFGLALGEVTSVDPLVISVDQKLKLTERQLVLTSAVRDCTVKLTFAHETEPAQGEADLTHAHAYSGDTQAADLHSHSYSGRTEGAGYYDLTHTHKYEGTKSFTLHLALRKGERVLLLRADGGQKYIVLDRLEALHDT